MTQQAVTTTEDQVATGVLVTEKDNPLLRRMLQTMAIEADLPGGSADEFVFSIMEDILAAESVDDIFESQKSPMVSGKDFAGRPFYLAEDDITLRKSKHDKFPFYAIFKVVEIATGEEHVVNCGGLTFMATLHALRLKEYFVPTEENPFGRSLVLQATPSPEGAYLSLKPFKIVAAPSRAKK